ncbi:hypothetical protein P5673_018643, partial [Acropora cervicornis]
EPLTTEDVQAFVDSVESTRPATDAQLERIREASRYDAQLQKVMDVTLKGWPAGVEDVPYQIQEFFDSRGHLSESFDRRNGTRELPPLQPGDWVRTKLENEKQWTTEAKVVSKDQSPRSYIIDTGGRRLRRNRRFLRKVPTPACHDTPEDDSLIPDISSESTPTDIQEENDVIPVCSDTSPTSNLNLVPEQRTSSGRLVRKPIRYREDL